MKVPTVGTSVFAPFNTSVTSKPLFFTTNFPVDFALSKRSNGADAPVATSRLQGGLTLETNSTSAESTPPTYFQFDSNTQMSSTNYNTGFGSVQSMLAFRRASGFMDVVCFSGVNGVTTIPHNLGVVPELMITKRRGSTASWQVYTAPTGASAFLNLNTDAAVSTGSSTRWNETAPTASVFTIGSAFAVDTFVNYLFATCPGVSKVGSYTGNGGTQAIACGFTGGARFVLIKRTDASGDWYVYDTARGMTTLTDPYLLLNSTAAETATLGSVTTTTGGFTVDATILAAINTNAASYIFLAIA
jgi:hypothetical protein